MEKTLREIKFRGKRIDNGEWVYGFYLTQPKDGGSWNEPPSQEQIYYMVDDCSISKRWHEIDPTTVGQYTGKKDKINTEIYDGDIVFDDAGYNGLVQWCELEHKYIVMFGSVEIELCEYKGSDLEVIGNIHGNPELLNGERYE